MTRETWLNGWPRASAFHVLLGTQAVCIGCGRDYGTTRVAFDADTVRPDHPPAWPFDVATCPVCAVMQAPGGELPYGDLARLYLRYRQQEQP